jgi:hypothetical protein
MGEPTEKVFSRLPSAMSQSRTVPSRDAENTW